MPRPEGIDWAALGVDLGAGMLRSYHTRADGQRFLDAGAPRVLFSQPMASEADVDATIVYGVNQDPASPVTSCWCPTPPAPPTAACRCCACWTRRLAWKYV